MKPRGSGRPFVRTSLSSLCALLLRHCVSTAGAAADDAAVAAALAGGIGRVQSAE